MNAYRVRQWRRSLSDHLRDCLHTVRAKGLKHFQRPLLLAAAPALLSYILSRPISSEIQGIEASMAALEAGAQYADRYQALQERLRALSSNAPEPANQSQWLQDTVRETLKAEGLIATSLSQPQVQAQGAVAVVSINIACRATYRQLGRWIARVESSKILLRFSSLAVGREESNKTADPTVHSVSATIDMMGTKKR